MVLGNESELVGKNVKIKMVDFFDQVSKKEYIGIVKNTINFGHDVIMIKLDSGKLVNTRYICTIEIVD